MSNSKLVNYTLLSPNFTPGRKAEIDTITIHCMAGNATVEGCGATFQVKRRRASSNYGVDSKGRIGLYVNEADTSWCSSNYYNDRRAITIEVANDGDAKTGWHVSDKALAALVDLLVDICYRNDIPELRWRADKNLIGNIEKQNMTVHRWFANKDCPGNYLYGKHSEIANKVNDKLFKLRADIDRGRKPAPDKSKPKHKEGEIEIPSSPLRPSFKLKTLKGVALDVIAGKYGNGVDRANRLKKEGYDPDVIQKLVNKILSSKN